MSEAEKYPEGRINFPIDAIMANIERNIRRPLPQVQPHDPQDQAIALVLGGPSLNDTIEDLKEKHLNGMKVVSVNGTHDYLIEQGIRPAAHIMLDSRRFNSRFVKNWQKETKYLIASQCHPKVFETLEGAQVYIYHPTSNDEQLGLLHAHYHGRYYTIIGGSTVGLRAIPLLRMLGFWRIEIYGFDSCYMDKIHHAYDQKENNRHKYATVNVNGKEFACTAWMHSQAKEFMEMAGVLGDQVQLVVHGNGLIAHLINTASEK